LIRCGVPGYIKSLTNSPRPYPGKAGCAVRIKDIFSTKRFALSFEVYPPKTDAARDAMYAEIGRLAEYTPGFVS
jgi:hypothetical protein